MSKNNAARKIEQVLEVLDNHGSEEVISQVMREPIDEEVIAQGPDWIFEEAEQIVDLNGVAEASDEQMAQTVEEQVAEQTVVEDKFAKYESLPTKSAKIRAMHADGYSRSQIAKHLGIIYQHVRNVLTQPAKRAATIAQ